MNVAVRFGVNAAKLSDTSPDCIAGALSSIVALSNTFFKYVPSSRLPSDVTIVPTARGWAIDDTRYAKGEPSVIRHVPFVASAPFGAVNVTVPFPIQK